MVRLVLKLINSQRAVHGPRGLPSASRRFPTAVTLAHRDRIVQVQRRFLAIAPSLGHAGGVASLSLRRRKRRMAAEHRDLHL